MKRLIIVEDEAIIADHLEILLEQLGYEVLGIVDTATDLFALLKEKTPELILLDIQISGDLDGVEIAHILNQKYRIPFVFISSNTDDKTLARVKHTEPNGFISKPFKVEQLRSVLKLIQTNVSSEPQTSEQSDSLFVKDGQGYARIAFTDIRYAKADDNYTQLFTSEKRFVLSSTLKEVEKKLVDHGFIRSHRSYLINLKKVTRVGNNFVLIDEDELPMSEKYKRSIMDRLNFF